MERSVPVRIEPKSRGKTIGIGPFSRKILHALEYPAESYHSVPEGAKIITTVFNARTSESSHRLAWSFGVGVTELGKHMLDANAANLESLSREFGEVALAHFINLREAGFQFYFLPIE